MFESLSFGQFVLLYIVLQIVYVVLNTITNITKIKCGKLVASFVSAICYGFYVIVVVATASNQPIYIKIILTAITNLVGVFFGMLIMEKLRKDRLWEIVATVKNGNNEIVQLQLQFTKEQLSFNIAQLVDGDYVFHIYSKNQKESAVIKKILTNANAKYIVHEENVRL